MIDKDDIRASVSAGILNERQAASLTALAHSRKGARENLAPGDEPFELFKGFNEIFIVIGLIILAIGWMGVSALSLVTDIVNLQQAGITFAIIGAVILWFLSEYFIRRRRMIAPAIALAIMFGGNAAFGFTAAYAQPFMIGQNNYESLPLPLFFSTLALFAYWFRFRVPFAMAMIAVGMFVVAIVFAASRGGEVTNISDLFLLSAGGPFAWITLALGVVVFIIAMVFDMSDPHRVTRRSANGFWLHVVAAPALVNTVALTLLDQNANGLLLIFLALFALVAIIIDRRSFLIAAIGYIVTLAATIMQGDGAAMIVLLLGVILLLLGAFWEKIRAVILRMMPGFIPLHKLPPSHS